MANRFAENCRAWRQRTGNVRMRLRAALIDMDGTLYDSMSRHSTAWKRLADEQGWNYGENDFFMHEGRTGRDTIRIYNPEASQQATEQLYHLKTVYFNQLPPVDPMPGAGKMLDELAAAGIKRVLVTGSAQNSLLKRLDTDFPGAFAEDMRITARDVRNGKPNPEPFLSAMLLARVWPAQAMVIENAPLGVQAGHASGAFTVAVNTGPIPDNALIDAGADVLFPSMEEFAKALPMLLSAF